MNGGGGGGGGGVVCFFSLDASFRHRISPWVGGHGCAKGETGGPAPRRPVHVAGGGRKVRPDLRRGVCMIAGDRG